MSVLDDNLLGYTDRVRRWLHELSPDTSFWSDTFIAQQVNASYRRRCTHLVMAHEGYFTNVATRDLTANQERYQWPPGLERCLKMEVVRSDGTTVPLERLERHYAANASAAVQSGGIDTYGPSFRPIGGGFVLEPAPGATTVDALRIEYFGLPTQLQVDGDSWHADFPRSLDEICILDATIACLDSEGLMETGSMRTVARQRSEWEDTWERYIDSKVVSTNKIMPFQPHYQDA